ncbi:ATP-binding protein, partial [Staphylococcus capitis]
THQTRQRISDHAVKLPNASNYRTAPTIQFLLTHHPHYFIHINPPIQLQHTLTQIPPHTHLLQPQLYLFQYPQ